MHSCLLKKLLPFALTFIVGMMIGGLFKSHSSGPAMWAWSSHSTPLLGHEGPFGYRFEHRYGCRMHSRDLVAETKPLVIRFKPDAHWPLEVRGMAKDDFLPVFVHVTFGADGKVQEVQPPNDLLVQYHNYWPKVRVWAAAADAARNIQFEPETINSVPVSVEKDVEIQFIDDGR